MNQKFKIIIGYNQFLIFDESIMDVGHDWTEAHFNQGFARRSSAIGLRTLNEYSEANVNCFIGIPYSTMNQYVRVISTGFECISGKVVICGPEEVPGNSSQQLQVAPGSWKLTAAFYMLSLIEHIDVFFENSHVPNLYSEILLADAALSPVEPLIETSKIPLL